MLDCMLKRFSLPTRMPNYWHATALRHYVPAGDVGIEPTPRRLECLGLEYRYLALYLQDKISLGEMITKLETEIRHYAKRQMTWFHRNKRIVWIEPKDIKRAAKELKRFLK